MVESDCGISDAEIEVIKTFLEYINAEVEHLWGADLQEALLELDEAQRTAILCGWRDEFRPQRVIEILEDKHDISFDEVVEYRKFSNNALKILSEKLGLDRPAKAGRLIKIERKIEILVNQINGLS